MAQAGNWCVCTWTCGFCMQPCWPWWKWQRWPLQVEMMQCGRGHLPRNGLRVKEVKHVKTRNKMCLFRTCTGAVTLSHIVSIVLGGSKISKDPCDLDIVRHSKEAETIGMLWLDRIKSCCLNQYPSVAKPTNLSDLFSKSSTRQVKVCVSWSLFIFWWLFGQATMTDTR